MKFEITIKQTDMIRVGNRQAPAVNLLYFNFETPVRDYALMAEAVMNTLALHMGDTVLGSVDQMREMAHQVKCRLTDEIEAEAKQLAEAKPDAAAALPAAVETKTDDQKAPDPVGLLGRLEDGVAATPVAESAGPVGG